MPQASVGSRHRRVLLPVQTLTSEDCAERQAGKANSWRLNDMRWTSAARVRVTMQQAWQPQCVLCGDLTAPGDDTSTGWIRRAFRTTQQEIKARDVSLCISARFGVGSMAAR